MAVAVGGIEVVEAALTGTLPKSKLNVKTSGKTSWGIAIRKKFMDRPPIHLYADQPRY